MGDMGDDFRALRVHVKERRRVRTGHSTTELVLLKLPFVEQAKGVYRMDSRDGAVMYYPGSSQWQHKGRVYRGSGVDLKQWLVKRGLL